jgi:hypothetical protein
MEYRRCGSSLLQLDVNIEGRQRTKKVGCKLLNPKSITGEFRVLWNQKG